MTEHTPGPWFTDPNAANHVISDARPICSIGYHNTALPDSGRAENAANARLIAAAPELLEALEAAKISAEDEHKSACERADWHNNNTPGVGQSAAYAQRPPEPAWLPKARAAIAKARGE